MKNINILTKIMLVTSLVVSGTSHMAIGMEDVAAPRTKREISMMTGKKTLIWQCNES